MIRTSTEAVKNQYPKHPIANESSSQIPEKKISQSFSTIRRAKNSDGLTTAGKKLPYFAPSITRSRMYTFLSFKRNTAVVIFLAFVFRLYIISVCAFASPDTAQSKYSTSHLSAGIFKKRRRIADEVLVAGFEKYSTVEIFEEDSDSEKEFVRASSPALLPFVYSLFRGFVHAQESRYWFDSVTSNVLPRKYLAFSILRI